MWVEGKTLILGTSKCSFCDGQGSIAVKVPCSTCGGTGRGPRGGARGCKTCFGSGRVRGEAQETCLNCDGGGTRPSEFSDFLPPEIWKTLRFRVYRSEKDFDHDAHLFNSFMAVNAGAEQGRFANYADYSNSSDQSLIDAVIEGSIPQAARVTDEWGLLCDHVAIIREGIGYRVGGAIRRKAI